MTPGVGLAIGVTGILVAQLGYLAGWWVGWRKGHDAATQMAREELARSAINRMREVAKMRDSLIAAFEETSRK